MYTQPGILDDTIFEEKVKGLQAGKDLINKLDPITVVYEDLDISEGMQWGIDKAKEKGRTIEYRMLGEGWEERQRDLEEKHARSYFGMQLS